MPVANSTRLVSRVAPSDTYRPLGCVYFFFAGAFLPEAADSLFFKGLTRVSQDSISLASSATGFSTSPTLVHETRRAAEATSSSTTIRDPYLAFVHQALQGITSRLQHRQLRCDILENCIFVVLRPRLGFGLSGCGFAKGALTLIV